MSLHKPRGGKSPIEETETSQDPNKMDKKSSNITATTSNARSSELDSMRKISKDQTTISAADETGYFFFTNI